MKIEKTDYGAWWKTECTQVCGWPGRTAGYSVTSSAAKGHVRETGHETALIRTSSVHYRPPLGYKPPRAGKEPSE